MLCVVCVCVSLCVCVCQVDALAENFLKSTGRSSDSEDEDEEFGMQQFLGPQVSLSLSLSLSPLSLKNVA